MSLSHDVRVTTQSHDDEGKTGPSQKVHDPNFHGAQLAFEHPPPCMLCDYQQKTY
jgi:hypothetical protein